MSDAKNSWIVVLGTSTSPLSFVGPFDTDEEAEQHAELHEKENPSVPAVVEPLTNPLNC